MTGVEAKFLDRVELIPFHECWEWRLRVGSNGYPHFTVGGKTWKANRLSWLLFRGPILPGLCVCHRCDNRSCVNPAHLFLGTRRDNMQDCVRKGRIAFGERQGSSKLTAHDVRWMRKAYAAKLFNMTELAVRFGVAKSTAREAIRGVWWRSL